MRINLADIPEEGQTYKFNRNTGEINESLKDFLGCTPYETEFFLRPLDSANFEISGYIKTHLDEECSRCGMDFKLKVDEDFRQLLTPGLKLERDEQYAKSNHFSELDESAPATYEYQGGTLEIGEFMHEVVALAAPFNPAPAVKANGDCTLCDKNINTHNFGYSDQEVIKESPFEALKTIKL